MRGRRHSVSFPEPTVHVCQRSAANLLSNQEINRKRDKHLLRQPTARLVTILKVIDKQDSQTDRQLHKSPGLCSSSPTQSDCCRSTNLPDFSKINRTLAHWSSLEPTCDVEQRTAVILDRSRTSLQRPLGLSKTLTPNLANHLRLGFK